MAEISYGGEYGTPWRITVLPTHLIPVVEMTRWPWIVMASAPPAHIALTTAWMSCWCTIAFSTSSPASARPFSGASSSTTVSPGPSTARMPAGSARRAACSSRRVSWALSSPSLRSSTSALRSVISCWRTSTRWLCC